MRPPARLARSYFNCRFGQLHVHQAIPPGGGFDEATALLCLPGERGDGRFFHALLGPLGADRSIYAVDLPGHGGSDAPAAGAGAEQNALAMADLLDTLHQRRVDLLAHGPGAETALALAGLRGGALLRRLVLSAAAAPTVQRARALGVDFRELPLAAADAEAVTATAVAQRLSELIEFLGSAGGGR
ncbi:MAG TPA: alpha/beta fold hydrolase [Steroidobacteraceae bacterium]|nr:alpha/beta fold hydrolase [Steroidobacteraceae bacterium]